ncbi:hypothetical protein AB6A40_002111 [Gnathostoma spinigerum]|uniref:Lipase maturation factor n=1 Tax=Gnathostoma spinigerum TaxID=75299 RepID=A0ABD6E7Y4_9BILA
MKKDVLKNVLLYGHSYIYLVAFVSLYWQIPGLYGENGLLPAASKLRCNCTRCDYVSPGLTVLPFIINFFHVAPSYGLQILTLIGIALSSLSFVCASMRNTIVYFSLFAIYSSLYLVGDTFLYFQWDTLLLEAGFLMVLLAPVPLIGSSPADNISIFLVRWLAFRLMYASGVVKLTSNCPMWWGLRTLDIHFESQCIPTWLAYYFHHTPLWFRHFLVAFTFFVEIILPPMFFLPFKSARYFSFYPQVILMLGIMCTGNYNYFNAICALHCAAVLIDSKEYKFSSYRLFGESPLFVFLRRILSASTMLIALFLFIKYFDIRIDGFSLSSRIAFFSDGFFPFVDRSVFYLTIIGIISFICEIISAVVRYFTEYHVSRFRALLHLIYVILVAVPLFSISIVPFATLSETTQAYIPQKIVDLHLRSYPYQITHSYGLFRRMTGIHGRPEIIMEGAYDPNGPWRPFHFYAKPGRLSTAPRYIIPYHPRLDWQMWFAALGAYQHNPFFISLTYHLLHNNSDVTYLMEKYPFQKKLPSFIRANLYFYHYTDLDEKKNYWKREFQEEYMPPITKDDLNVVTYLEQNGFLLKKKFEFCKNHNTWMEERLKAMHMTFRGYDPALIVQSLFIPFLIIILLRIASRIR